MGNLIYISSNIHFRLTFSIPKLIFNNKTQKERSDVNARYFCCYPSRNPKQKEADLSHKQMEILIKFAKEKGTRENE